MRSGLAACVEPRGASMFQTAVPFFFTATFSFIIYEFFALGQFSDFLGTRQFSLMGLTIRISPAPSSGARLIRRLLLVFATILILMALHFFLPGARDLFNQQRRLALICGLLFGPLLAIWINNIFLTAPGAPIARFSVAVGACLIGLFFFGSFGSQLADILNRYLYRVNSLGAFGIQATFDNASHAAKAPIAVVSTPTVAGS